MTRPTIKGTKKKKRKQYKRVRVEYGHKQDILNYIHAAGKERQSKQQLISKWRANDSKTKAACESGHARHLNFRERGMAAVLSKEAEEDIVLWINTLRKDGAPVSRTMLN
ncbi:hypothetical protein F442_09800 [Phytophthora nicotianae P10297]|uniref:HTH CENPB-type domain-containing protein n=2 Tax=Phytophthora nicotianae TaxID=4792 RepID=W2R8Q9_PHYN3|nr:hypothetical protein PPTG_01400 [Phytophthora nicotianae INRA-310]ETN21104.1 hypothetical protein PPTG_01400 [Phytophthora nicotianae INRA-310]ETP43423.1 hypothetical protein F442_09800 [Phytophthora nicotianae P10297]